MYSHRVSISQHLQRTCQQVSEDPKFPPYLCGGDRVVDWKLDLQPGFLPIFVLSQSYFFCPFLFFPSSLSPPPPFFYNTPRDRWQCHFFEGRKEEYGATNPPSLPVPPPSRKRSGATTHFGPPPPPPPAPPRKHLSSSSPFSSR